MQSIGLLLLVGAALVQDDPPARQPNVLILVVDDLNDWVGYLGGHAQASTPSIDRLAASGIAFTNAHVQAPVCTPSRVSFCTGLLPSTTGVYFLSPMPGDIPSLEGVATLMSRFRSAGYETLGCGKTFEGHERRAFERNGRPRRHDGGAPGVGVVARGIWSWGPTRSGEDADVHDAGVAEWAAAELAKSYDAPFLLCVGFSLPHVPMLVPGDWLERFPAGEIQLPAVVADDQADVSPYARELVESNSTPPLEWMSEEGRWRSCVQAYLAATSFVDGCVGRVLEALAASEHAEDTIVVLFSDHGFHLGEKGHFGKRTLWEESTRVPLVILHPDLPAATIDAPVGLVDVLPTLLELVGIEAGSGPLDGVSLVPLLRDPTLKWERPALTTHGPGNHSVRSQRWRYTRYHDGSEELYDHESDPGEWLNLAARPELAEVLAEHRRWLPQRDARISRTAPCSGLVSYRKAEALRERAHEGD